MVGGKRPAFFELFSIDHLPFTISPALVGGLLAVGIATASCAKRPPVQQPTAPAPPLTAIVPAPVTLEPTRGAEFVVTSATAIYAPSGDDRVAWVAKYVADLIGIAAAADPPRIVGSDPSPAASGTQAGGIHLRIGDVPAAGDEGYELTVTAERVTIAANRPAGLFYGVQTFRQLLPPFVEYEAVRVDKARLVRAPAVRIVDRPRFGWRGAMLDVARHFMSADEVKRYIDLLALYKFNRLHLHLADDQGWRIEVKSWPKLAAHGGTTEVGGGPGGFYTQQQYTDLVAYADQRFITIVPEIDMPGHTNAALASYAELNCDGKPRQLYTGIEVGFSALCVDKDVTYRFIDDVVREIASMTTGPYFHIGGDEVKTLTPQQYVGFIERVQKIVQTHGKEVVGWDEIAPASLLPTTIVQHWRPKTSPDEAVRKNARIIMSVADRAYLDMKYDANTPLGLNWAGYIDERHAYTWEPTTVAGAVPEKLLAGVEAPLWTETLANIRDVEQMAFPRLAAIAEIGWSPASRRDWDEFKVRLGAQAPRWTALGVNFYRASSVPWR